MSDQVDQAPAAEVARILESAKRLGVEVEEAEALQWLTAMAATQTKDQVTMDSRTGVFGNRITMLDFPRRTWSTFARLAAWSSLPMCPAR